MYKFLKILAYLLLVLILLLALALEVYGALQITREQGAHSLEQKTRDEQGCIYSEILPKQPKREYRITPRQKDRGTPVKGSVLPGQTLVLWSEGVDGV